MTLVTVATIVVDAGVERGVWACGRMWEKGARKGERRHCHNVVVQTRSSHSHWAWLWLFVVSSSALSRRQPPWVIIIAAPSLVSICARRPKQNRKKKIYRAHTGPTAGPPKPIWPMGSQSQRRNQRTKNISGEKGLHCLVFHFKSQ